MVEIAAQARDDRIATTAILVRNRSHLADIVPRLREAGLRFRAIEIEGLGHRPVVQDLLALTRALSHPADSSAWLALLRAPWCGLLLSDIHALASSNPVLSSDRSDALARRKAQACQKAAHLQVLASKKHGSGSAMKFVSAQSRPTGVADW